MAQAQMILRKGVSVPMDTDGISPDSLEAAFAMGVRTLLDRSTAAGDSLDWSTLEMVLEHPKVAQGMPADECSLMVLRAAVIR
jgi:hypothetical protein